ncbi:superoxide dismutase [Mn] [Spirochaetota bacterium]|nr:superoxide dismutase [Mn] [Spirochaetota bacterium]
MHTLPPLPYAASALEPHIDAKTMEIHHGKHHSTYVTKLNAAIQGSEAANIEIAELMGTITADSSPAVRNNGGGHYNHSLFWTLISPTGGGEPAGDLRRRMETAFGSIAEFKEKFAAAALARFGSGWTWLCETSSGDLTIGSTPNQDNPLMPASAYRGKPLLALDVWEHAYYLTYQNRRPDYVNAFWNIVDWNAVAKRM